LTNRHAGTVLGIPGTLFYAIFMIAPLIMALIYSMTDRFTIGARPVHFVGFNNFAEALTDPVFQSSLLVTGYMAIIAVMVPLVLGLALAILLDGESPLYRVLRAVFFVPIILSPVVISTIWSSILGAQGILNTALRGAGLGNLALNWIGDPYLAPITVALVTAWQSLAFSVTVYQAGLQSIPLDLQEAGTLDGVSGWARFRFITWPLIAPAFTINCVVLLIGGFKLYDQAVVLTNGGPGNATQTVAMNIVATNFVSGLSGLASAKSFTLLVVVAAISFVVLRLLQRREVN
ncbi:sugar ABC transporter permease, partial [Salinibacterium sp.]|uniref:carbohydrate ABC transporter permease n=1 Tax=Salinibacterium sp. TaxID=1915057 RepID=UPI00286C6122